MEELYKKALETAQFLNSKISSPPQIAVILGSGLGPLVDDIENPVEIDYKDIPNFPLTTVQSHAGKLVEGRLGGKNILAMKGRFHYYEGNDILQVTFAIRVFKLMGIENILVTNAAGGVNESFSPGDIMLIKDHISLFAPSPLRGKNIEEFGTRFPDMSQAYDKNLLDMARNTAASLGIKVQEGVYAFAQGPMFETPAEIRALRSLGADAVGMSTVPEVITARHAGIRVLGISCITNMATGILNQPLNHEEVMETAKKVEQSFSRLVKDIIKNWCIQ